MFSPGAQHFRELWSPGILLCCYKHKKKGIKLSDNVPVNTGLL